MSWYRAFLAFFCAVATSVSCLAQDRETLLDDFPLARFSLGIIEPEIGSLEESFEVLRHLAGEVYRAPGIDLAFLLNKEWVQDELGLTPSQVRQIREKFKPVHDRRASVPADLLQILDSKQRENFLDILIRCRIRSMGIVEFFSQPKLGLSREELEAVRELVTKLEPIYTEHCTELRDNTLQKLRDVLTTEQQEQLNEWSSGFLESLPSSLNLLTWQMKNIKLFEETIADKTHARFRGFFIFPAVYSIDYDGNVEPETSVEGPEDLKANSSVREQKEREAWVKELLFSGLHDVITGEKVSVEIGCTDDQIKFALRIMKNLRDFETEWVDSLSKIFEAKEHEHSEVYAEYMRLKAELVAEGIRELEDILLPHQRRFLETLSMLYEVLKGGFPAAMVYGQTGRTLKLTAKQKREIEEICKKSVSEIESQTLNWEKEIFSKLKDSFSDSRKEELNFLFNFPISQGHVNIYMLLKGGL